MGFLDQQTLHIFLRSVHFETRLREDVTTLLPVHRLYNNPHNLDGATLDRPRWRNHWQPIRRLAVLGEDCPCPE